MENEFWYGSWINGPEYQNYDSQVYSDMPCARCYTKTRSAFLMIPAKRDCPSGWTKEYEEMKLGQTMSSQNNMLYMEYGVTLSRGDTREQVYSR
ncbi:hypothetical protein EB796_013620 [Bugula neritina]|uniref:Uncharacterized protein n=1 Tax=Bugula neritina TaxID=10212 RepID=A0A7J7JQX5_BUGNE|nr:hypothetical protein EB796_013620 [Bugula neritina]